MRLGWDHVQERDDSDVIIMMLADRTIPDNSVGIMLADRPSGILIPDDLDNSVILQ